MFKTGQESLHGSSFSARQRRDNTRGGIRAIVPPHFARSRANSARKIFSRLAGRGKQMGREIKEDDSWRYRGVEITPSADDDLDEQNGGFEIPAKRVLGVFSRENNLSKRNSFLLAFSPPSPPSRNSFRMQSAPRDDHREISNKNPPPDSTNLSNLRGGEDRKDNYLFESSRNSDGKGRKREIRKGRSLP